MEEDSDYEEEIVCVDISGLIKCDWSNFVGKKCKFINLDSDQPIMQMGKHVFKGTYKDCIGTRLLVDSDESPENILSSFKILDMQKIYLQEKTEEMPKSDTSVTEQQNSEKVSGKNAKENSD